MSDFNPDAASKSDILFTLTNKHEQVRAAFADLNKSKGFVVWDGSMNDDNTICRAFQHGLAMLRTNCTDEWVVTGSVVFAIVRMLPGFIELETPEIACGLTLAGYIRSMRIYLLPYPKMPSGEFIIGHDGRFVRGNGINLPFALMEDEVPENPRRRALRGAPDPNIDYEAAAVAAHMGIDPNDACFGIRDEDPPYVDPPEDPRETLELRIPRPPPDDVEYPF